MILFLIPFLIILLLLFLRISKSISKFIAIFIDFLLIGGIVAYVLHGAVSTKIATGNAVYFWNIVFGVGACIIYYALLIFLINNLPKIAAIINYFVSWVGTFIIYLFIFSVFNDEELPRLLNNYNLSMLMNIIIVTLLAFITFKARQNIFGIHQGRSEA